MIIERKIKEWSEAAPRKKLDMIEQDLIIEKALVELYKQPLVRENLAFKGGVFCTFPIMVKSRTFFFSTAYSKEEVFETRPPRKLFTLYFIYNIFLLL